MPRPLVVKIGGSMAEDDTALQAMARSLASLAKSGMPLVLVHGGGKDINRHLAWLGETPRFKNGLRVTSDEAMKVVEMTLSGYVNKKLVGYLAIAGVSAAGISGVDGPTLLCEALDADLGLVGHIVAVKPALVHALLAGGFLPVLSPVSVDSAMTHYNVNADAAASALATSLKAERLVYVSDVPGVLDAEKKILPRLDSRAIDALVASGIAAGGMIPKLRSCQAAVQAGVSEVHICGFGGEKEFLGQLSGGRNGGTIIA